MQKKYQIIVQATGKGIRSTTRNISDGFQRSTKSVRTFSAAMEKSRRLSMDFAGTLRKAFYTAAGAAGIGYMVNQQLSLGDATVKTADKIGLSTDALQEYRYAAKRSGVESRALEMGLQRFTRRMAEAADGTGELAPTLEKYGIAVRDANGNMRASEDVLGDLADAIKNAESDSEALRIAFKAFDSEGAALVNMLKDGRKGLEEYRQAARRLGIVVEEDLLRKSEKAADQITDLKAVISSQLLRAIASLAPEIARITKDFTDWIRTQSDLSERLRATVSLVWDMAKGLGSFVGTYGKFIAGFAATSIAINIVGRLVSTVQALNAAFAVLTGMGIIKWVGSLRLALNTLAAAAGAAGIAVQGAAAAGAAWGVMKIYEAVNAYRDMRDAQKDAVKWQERSEKATADLLAKYAEFKDIEIPGNIMEMPRRDLAKFEHRIRKARAYYRVLVADLEQQSKETGLFGGLTDEAVQAQKELKSARSRLNEIEDALDQVKSAGAEAAAGMKKPAEAVKATSEQLDEFAKQAQKAYDHARSQAEKYAQEVISWEEKIKNARMSTADKIRELQRKGLSEAEQWNDKRLQADEKMMAARQALREQDYERAKRLADEAQSLYADLATEVRAERDGEDVVVKSIEDTKRVAVAGVKEAGAFVEQLYQMQKETAEKSRAEWEAAADKIDEKLEWVARARETRVGIDLPNLADAQKAINRLTKDETKHITVVVTKKVKTEEAKATGGRVGMARGGRFPGNSKKDSLHVMARPGEGFVRNEALSVWDRLFGTRFFDGVNAPWSEAGKAIISALKGNIRLPHVPKTTTSGMKFAAGGRVPSAGEVMTINFRAGGVEMPLQVMGKRGSTRQQVREFDAELRKMGLARG